MVKISLDDISLSKMRSVFMLGTDRTWTALNNYLDMNPVKVPFYNRFFTLATNIGQASMEKIGRL